MSVLGLTSKQYDLFNKNELDFYATSDFIRYKINQISKVIIAGIMKKDAATNKVYRLICKTVELNAEASKLQIKYWRKLKSILTPVKLNDLIELVNRQFVNYRDALFVHNNVVYPPGLRNIFCICILILNFKS